MTKEYQGLLRDDQVIDPPRIPLQSPDYLAFERPGDCGTFA